MIPNISNIYTNFNQTIEALFEKRWGILKLTIIIFLLFSLLYFPEIIYKRISGDWNTNDLIVQNFVNKKINNPLKPYLNAEKWDHFSKRDLRITPYLIGKTLHIEAIKLFYIQALILLPLFIFLCLKTINELTKDSVIAFWATLGLLFTYIGNSFNYDTFFYDSYAYLGLLAAFFWRKSLGIVPILLVTFFVDERSILPAGIFILVDQLGKNKNLNLSGQFAQLIWRNPLMYKVLISITLYLIIRYYLYQSFGLVTPVGQDAGVHLGLAFIHKSKVAFALFSAFKFNYLFIALALTNLIRNRNFIQFIAFAGSILLIFVMATAVEDVTRSLAYGFIIIFGFFQLLPRISENPQQTRLLCTIVALGNLLLPTYSLLLTLYQVPIFTWAYLF
ncbi:MAG: hypothetical protein RL638_867 [Bacteroidota bacterium]|jgi:hypothetical protein